MRVRNALMVLFSLSVAVPALAQSTPAPAAPAPAAPLATAPAVVAPATTPAAAPVAAAPGPVAQAPAPTPAQPAPTAATAQAPAATSTTTAAPAWLATKETWRSGFSVFVAPLTVGVLSDGSTPVLDAMGSQIGTGRASQPTLEFAIGALYDLIDLCKVYGDKSCIKFQPLLSLHAGGYVYSGMPYLQFLMGGHVEFYPGKQRAFAIRGGLGFGFQHAFVPSVNDQQAGTLALAYQKNPANASTPVLYLELGAKLNLASFTSHPFASRLAVALDARFQNGVGNNTWWAAANSFAASLHYHF